MNRGKIYKLGLSLLRYSIFNNSLFSFIVICYKFHLSSCILCLIFFVSSWKYHWWILANTKYVHLVPPPLGISITQLLLVFFLTADSQTLQLSTNTITLNSNFLVDKAFHLLTCLLCRCVVLMDQVKVHITVTYGHRYQVEEICGKMCVFWTSFPLSVSCNNAD